MLPNAPWQDWILSDGVLNDTSGSYFRCDQPPVGDRAPGTNWGMSSMPTTNAGDGSIGGGTMELNDEVIADILAATRAMPLWKACEIEGTSWAGTTEENIQKYVSLVGSGTLNNI